MNISGVLFLFEDAAKSIRRNGLMSLAALTTVTIALAVFGGSLFGLYRLHQFVAAQPGRFEVAAFMRADTTREDSQDVMQRARGISGVRSVRLVTKEDAWADLCDQDRKRGTAITTALADQNPLPDRIDVRLDDPKSTRRIAAMLRDTKRFPEIEAVRDERETLDKLLATSRVVRNVGGAVAAMLFLATGLVMQNTLRLTVLARRREIRVMQLVGATPAFIRLPLVLEGLFHGMLGAACAGGMVLFVVAQVSRYVGRFQTPLLDTIPAAPSPSAVIGVLLTAGATLGLVTSVLAIRRFLR